MFTVVAKLLIDETRKTHDMRLVLAGAVAVYREPNSKYKRRSEFIKQEQENFLRKKITLSEFLMRLTTQYNPVAYNMANFEGSEFSSDDEF